mgnify:CR=1 FL=1
MLTRKGLKETLISDLWILVTLPLLLTCKKAENLSDYELKRLENMRLNADVLRELGLAQDPSPLPAHASGRLNRKRARGWDAIAIGPDGGEGCDVSPGQELDAERFLTERAAECARGVGQGLHQGRGAAAAGRKACARCGPRANQQSAGAQPARPHAARPPSPWRAGRAGRTWGPFLQMPARNDSRLLPSSSSFRLIPARSNHCIPTIQAFEINRYDLWIPVGS